MRWAELILNYLQTLVWPAVAIAIIWIFRAQFRRLILGISKVSAFGAEAEFKEINVEIESAGKQLAQLTNPGVSIQFEGISAEAAMVEDDAGEAKEIEALAKKLSHVDLANLDKSDLFAALAEANSRFASAISRVLEYFGVPSFADSVSAGKTIAHLTKEPRWPSYLEIAASAQKTCAEIIDLDKKTKIAGDTEALLQTEEAAKRQMAIVFSGAYTLSILTQQSLKNMNET